MKYVRVVGARLGVVSMLALCHLALANGACPSDMAKSTEERLGAIDSWADFVVLYKVTRSCDSSALSYAFTQAVARLAAQPKGVVDLSIAVRKEPWLRRTVLRHLRSDAIAQEDADKIIVNVREACPSSAGNQSDLCKDVKRTLTKKRCRGRRGSRLAILPPRPSSPCPRA